MKKCTFNSNGVEDTRNLADTLAQCLKGGEIIFFRGPIGAGKTVMVSAIAQHFGFKSRPVSASFSLMKKYQNKQITIHHIDLFRLSEGEMFNLGFEELLEDDNALILAEWPDPAQEFFPADRLEIDVNLKQENKRSIDMRATGRTSALLLQELCKKIKK